MTYHVTVLGKHCGYSHTINRDIESESSHAAMRKAVSEAELLGIVVDSVFSKEIADD
jgi:hypothetical protein